MTNILKDITSTIKNWRLLVFLGAGLVIGSFFVFATPEASYLSLAIVFSVMMLTNGIVSSIFTIQNRKSIKGFGFFLVGSIIDIALGAYLAFNPEVTMNVLPYLVSFWFIMRSFQTFEATYEMRKLDFKGQGWLIALGIVLAAVGVLIAMNPLVGAAYLVALTGIAIFTMGVSYMVIGFKLRKVKMVAKKVKKAAKDMVDSVMNDINENIKAELGEVESFEPEKQMN